MIVIIRQALFYFLFSFMSKNFIIVVLIIILLWSWAFIWMQNEQITQDGATLKQYNQLIEENGQLNQKNTQWENTIEEKPTNAQNESCQKYISNGFWSKYSRSFEDKQPGYNRNNFNNLVFWWITGFTRKEIDNQYFSIRVPVQESGTWYRFLRNDSNEWLRTLDSIIAGDAPTHIEFSLVAWWRTTENIQWVWWAVSSWTCIINDDREWVYHVATAQQCGDRFCDTSMQWYTYITQSVSWDQTLVIRITHNEQLMDLLLQETLASLVIK